MAWRLRAEGPQLTLSARKNPRGPHGEADNIVPCAASSDVLESMTEPTRLAARSARGRAARERVAEMFRGMALKETFLGSSRVVQNSHT